MEIVPSDAFVGFRPDGALIFAKNSHRPKDEVQEIVYASGEGRTPRIKCTYIEIDDVDMTNAVILSKPHWMWGAEMGSNNRNVSVGNVGLKSRYNEGDCDAKVPRLTGQDLVRLGLERGCSAEECLDVITDLLERHGQGGPMSRSDPNLAYHNAFVLVDSQSAWLLETCGKFWAAEKLDASRHVSSRYSIRSNIHKMSPGLREKAAELNLWGGSGEFDFAECFGLDGGVASGSNIAERFEAMVANEPMNTMNIFRLLRDKDNKICYGVEDQYPTQSSQASFLHRSSMNVPSLHWFTGTPDPSESVFKPFVFTPNVIVSRHLIIQPNNTSGRHRLYELHRMVAALRCEATLQLLKDIESQCVQELDEYLETFAAQGGKLEELDNLMKDCVEAEVKLYR